MALLYYFLLTTNEVNTCNKSCLQMIAFILFRHYSTPLVPKLEGMKDFKGTVIHSHDYRVPDPFKDKFVVCLGGAASGQDICLDIASQAKQVSGQG